jgi:hypothetical protein
MRNTCILGKAVFDALQGFGLTNNPERKKIVAFTRDGCSTNNAAMNLLQGFLFNETLDIKCVSHAAANVGKELYTSCPLAVKFITYFNQMLNTSTDARLKYASLIETEVKRYHSNIRWFYHQESASQILKYWPKVIEMINDPGSFTPEIRDKLKTLLRDESDEIRLELSLFEDAAVPLAKLCYKQEGDGFLIPTTYDHWQSILSLLLAFFDGRKALENVKKMALALHPDDPEERDESVRSTTMKLSEAIRKMNDTTTKPDKLSSTILMFQACRLLNYKFISKTPYQSLVQREPGGIIVGEIQLLFKLIGGDSDTSLSPFIDELRLYQERSIQFVGRINVDNHDPSEHILDFWKENVLTLPNFAELARRIACCSPSSATVERLFSLLASFNDNQQSALADYAKARTMIRYNQIFRDHRNETL